MRLKEFVSPCEFHNFDQVSTATLFSDDSQVISQYKTYHSALFVVSETVEWHKFNKIAAKPFLCADYTQKEFTENLFFFRLQLNEQSIHLT